MPQVRRRARTEKIRRSWSALELPIKSTSIPHQPESFINEVISLISIEDNSAKLARNGKPNNSYLHLARDKHWQIKWRTVSSSSTDLYLRQKLFNGSPILSACLPTRQWPVSMLTVVEMMSRPSPSNWLARILPINGYIKNISDLVIGWYAFYLSRAKWF